MDTLVVQIEVELKYFKLIDELVLANTAIALEINLMLHLYFNIALILRIEFFLSLS